MSLQPEVGLTFRDKWGTELGRELGDEWWAKALSKINSSSSCARLGLMQLKLVHRAYYTKARLAKIFANTDAACPRVFKCKLDPDPLWAIFSEPEVIPVYAVEGCVNNEHGV
ncbi:hypothetical protein MHYP_G00020830 [Metynnis hypsauchen]